MFTTTLLFFLLFLSRVFAGILVSDVFSSQSQCDTSVDLFKNKKGETPCTVVLELLIPCNVNVSESSTEEISASACACNVAFYNLLSACAYFCIKKSVDPFYQWSQGCGQAVPLTRGYPFTAVITTVIPPWASKDLSSSGSFDPSTVLSGGWTTLQKITPVIVGLGVLILVGLFWWFCRVYRRRRSSRRAQGSNISLSHRRGESAGSYTSTSHLNAMDGSQLSLPVHRIRFFFSGMLPVRERRRGSDWNIEGEPGLPRRSSIPYDSPERRETDSFFTPGPSAHARNDTPPASPGATWSPFQTISRWWTSASPSKGRDYQAVHLLSARKNSKFGTDDDYHPELGFISSPPRNQTSNIRNDHTSGERVPAVVATWNGEGNPLSTPHTPQPETESAGTKHLPALRPNRPGQIVAFEDPPPTQPSPRTAPTTPALTPNLSAFPLPAGVRSQMSNGTFHTARTNLSVDQEQEQTVKPKTRLSPELLFPPSVRAAGYSIPQRPVDPVVRTWVSRVNDTPEENARNTATEPPAYDQANGSAVTLPLPPSQSSTHPYPYTNHVRSISDFSALDISRSPRPHLQDIDTVNIQNEHALNRLSLTVNEPTSPPPATSEDGSGDGYTGFTPLSGVPGSDALKSLEYTPYPSSAMLPSSTSGASQGSHPPPAGS